MRGAQAESRPESGEPGTQENAGSCPESGARGEVLPLKPGEPKDDSRPESGAPDAREDAPPKKGAQRFWEVLAREFWALAKLNLLYCACLFPSAALFLLGLFGFWNGLALLFVLPAAFPAGGAYSACVFCIAKMLRGDSGSVWHDFKRKWLENVKQAILPGIIYTTFVYAQAYLWSSWMLSGTFGSFPWLLLSFASLLVVGMTAPYFFLQVAYIDLKTAPILKNTLLLSFSNAGRSLWGASAGGAIWAAYFLFLPNALIFSPLVLLCGFSIPRLLTLMWVWPPVNRQFSIEEALRG